MLASFIRLITRRGLFAAVLLILLAGTASASDKIEWRSDYDSARREATEKGKPLFLDFGTEDCLHCRRMHQTTFRDPTVIKLINEGFVPLKVDASREPKLAQALRIQAYPTMVLAGNDGKIVGWIEGFVEVARLNEALQRAVAVQVPDWVARDFQEAAKCKLVEDYVGAISRLKKIADEVKDRSVKNKAREMLQEIEDKAAVMLKQVMEMEANGRASDTLPLMKELTTKFAGTQAAFDALQLKLYKSDDSELRSRRAKQLLADARKDFSGEHFLECLRKCETLQEAYSGLPEAKDAAFLVKQVNGSPEKIALVCEALNDQLALKYVGLADLHIGKEQPDFARICLERAKKLNPSSAVLSHVDARLAKIKEKIPGTSTSFPKPETP